MDRFFKRSTPSSENTQEETKTTEEEPTNMNESQEEKEEINFKSRRQDRNNEEIPKPTYEEFRNTYRRDNYIPSTHIRMAFLHNFPNSMIIHDVTEDIKLCNIKIIDFLNAHVRNWEFNREPDEVRIPQIARYIYESRTRIHTQFYLNYNFKYDRFEIIDGTHRYSALKMIKSLNEENGIIIDERLRNANGENTASWFNSTENIDWLLNSYVIVQMNFKSTINELIKLRDDINHSQPMPVEMRENSRDIEKNGIVNRIADEYIRRYKKCFAPKSNDENYLRNRRITNRDKFIVLISKIYDKYNININRIGTLQQRLEIANDKIRIELQENKIKCKQSIKNECCETGCYLFLYRDDELEEFI